MGNNILTYIQGGALTGRCVIGPPVGRNGEISPKLGHCVHAFHISRSEYLIAFEVRYFIDI